MVRLLGKYNSRLLLFLNPINEHIHLLIVKARPFRNEHRFSGGEFVPPEYISILRAIDIHVIVIRLPFVGAPRHSIAVSDILPIELEFPLQLILRNEAFC